MKATFHLSSECFIPFMVSMAYNKRAMFVSEMNEALLKAGQAGYVAKFERDIEWEYYRLSATKLIQKAAADLVPEERSLNVEDVSGVFILMVFGYSLAQIVMITECISAFKAKRERDKRVLPSVSSTDLSNYDDSQRPSIIVSSCEDYDFLTNNHTSDPSDLQGKMSASMMALRPHLMDAINVRRRSY